MSPMDLESSYGYCEHCGIVYALRKLKENQADETDGGQAQGFDYERGETNRHAGGAGADESESYGPDTVRWTCPDCNEVLSAANDGDLKFVIREHVREFHPNRSGSQA